MTFDESAVRTLLYARSRVLRFITGRKRPGLEHWLTPTASFAPTALPLILHYLLTVTHMPQSNHIRFFVVRSRIQPTAHLLARRPPRIPFTKRTTGQVGEHRASTQTQHMSRTPTMACASITRHAASSHCCLRLCSISTTPLPRTQHHHLARVRHAPCGVEPSLPPASASAWSRDCLRLCLNVSAIWPQHLGSRPPDTRLSSTWAPAHHVSAKHITSPVGFSHSRPGLTT